MTTTMTMMIAIYDVVVVIVDDDDVSSCYIRYIGIYISSSNYPSSCSSPYTSMPLPSLFVFLLSSLSVPSLPAFELFLCSRHVVTDNSANAAAAMAVNDDDAVDCDIMSMNMMVHPCLTLCWIPKSFLVVSPNSMDVSYSPLLTTS